MFGESKEGMPKDKGNYKEDCPKLQKQEEKPKTKKNLKVTQDYTPFKSSKSEELYKVTRSTNFRTIHNGVDDLLASEEVESSL